MIILTSNGISSEKLARDISPYTEGLTSGVIITTASSYKKDDWHIPRVTAELEGLGLTVGYFDFDEDDPGILLNFDVVEINGGNPFYLLNAIRKTGAEGLLKRISETKLLIGISAGALILQKSISLVAVFSPGVNEGVGLTDNTALGLADIEMIPHYHRFIEKFDNFEQRIANYERENRCEVLRIDDGEGVIFTEKDHYVVSHQ